MVIDLYKFTFTYMWIAIAIAMSINCRVNLSYLYSSIFFSSLLFPFFFHFWLEVDSMDLIRNSGGFGKQATKVVYGQLWKRLLLIVQKRKGYLKSYVYVWNNCTILPRSPLCSWYAQVLLFVRSALTLYPFWSFFTESQKMTVPLIDLI